ncbi:cysteine desulfurase NifS [Marispirochaeta aestuarii]|uniref:cysteine desulfurase n=1 Tax=Marispirochaeta aestuarii TaxID=1963862 RepID=A0A1Y1RXF0_9SPIO|nr:aminotransferase class V-fold PLP-dependent enzyme [Marispirochaeta aestuarii]ORC35050.1 cysteine desulfurase NifS [Marispirochaeta aestuarii]
MERVYLDNNATTMVDPKVKQAMDPYYMQQYGNPNSLHSFGTEVHPEMSIALDRLYEGIGAADEDDIIINACATEGNNTVLQGIWSGKLKENRPFHLVISQIEHPSIAHTADWLESMGVRVTRLPVDEQGLVTPEILKEHVSRGSADLVSIMWANNETGLINPVQDLCRTAHDMGALFHTDAVQAVGKIPVNVGELGCDYLTFSAHKFHGPKGVGGLFVKRGAPPVSLLYGGEQMGGKRAGTVNVAYMIGMGLAMKLATDALDYENTKVRELRDRLEDALKRIPDTVILGRRENRTPNTILVSFKGIEGEAFLWDLNTNGIAASTGSACSSEDLEADATLRAMKLGADLAHTAVRFSLSRFTTDEEIDYTIETIRKVVQRLRSISSTYS